MCNLNVLVRTDATPKHIVRRIPSFMMGVTSMSYGDNDDGDGIYCGKKVVKSAEKIDIVKYASEIEKSKIVLTHQRIATSGLSENYIQPFESDDFVLAHNGIMYGFAEGVKSDTFMLFEKFKAEFSKQEGEREKRVIASIKALLDKEDGSYSIFLYDKIGRQLYYFKNNTTSIIIYIGKTLMFATTSTTNKCLLSMLDGEFKELVELDVKEYDILRYSLDSNSMKWYTVGNIEKPQHEYVKSGKGYSKYSGYYRHYSWDGYDYDKKGRKVCFGQDDFSLSSKELQEGFLNGGDWCE